MHQSPARFGPNPSIQRHCAGPPFGAPKLLVARKVFNMPNRRDWDVTIGSRIEHVTDREVFAELFLDALIKTNEISVIQFNRPSWPHTTSVVIRVIASSKKVAVSRAKALVHPVLLDVARLIGGDGPFGWTMSVDARPAKSVAP